MIRLGFLALLFVACGAQQRFALPAPPLEMATDSDGRLFVSAEGVGGEGSRVLRLSRDLLQEDVLQLPPDVGLLRFALTSDKLVACFTNGSCSVYNSSDLQAGAQLTVEDVSLSSSNMALFTAPVSGGGDSFYAASFGSNSNLRRVRLVQHGTTADVSRSLNLQVASDLLLQQIDFHGGFIANSRAYFVATEHSPFVIRILRVCDSQASGSCIESGFPTVHEVNVDCRLPMGLQEKAIAMSVTVVRSFEESNTTVVFSLSVGPNFNYGTHICYVFLSTIDEALDKNSHNCSVKNSSLFANVTDCQDLSVSETV